MKWLRFGLVAALVATPFLWAGAAEVKTKELARCVPSDAYLFVYGKHNPKRDFQQAYLRDVWKTVEETQIIPQAVQIVSSRLSSADREKAGAVLNEIKQAAAPIKLEALANAKELVYAQKMTVMSEQIRVIVSQHLLVVRLTPEAAEQTQSGLKNLFALIEKYSQGKAKVESAAEGDATIVKLSVPQPFPFQPAVVRCGDVLIVSTSEAFARESLGLLVRGGVSKFDDPRLVEALRKLPPPDDALAFMDGKTLFGQMRGMVDFIRAATRDDKQGARIAGLIELLFDEVSIIDYVASVEYTEGNLNRSVEYGKLSPGAEAKTLTKVVGGGQPFADWARWVPADATSYSLSTGVNLHPLYERIVAVLRERFPEAAPKLEKFEQLQSQIGVHLDRDILQAFSGECVSVSLPACAEPARAAGSVVAMRCQKPERIRELLHRLVEAVKKVPAIAAQQLQLTQCQGLDGFEEISAVALAGFGLKPVVGFHDGWMIVGSHADAVKAVLATRAGKAPNIVGTKTFTQFHLPVQGAVQSISYSNTAEKIRKAAAVINQIGVMAPMILSTAGANAKPEQLKPVQEVFALLPSVAKIVAKFDYLQASMSVTQAGDQPGAFQTRSVTIIRPPAGK